jgi:hypothetical protein
MYIAGRWADRQLSRLELAMAVIVLSLVFVVYMQYLLKAFAYTERSLLENTMVNINTALQYHLAGHLLRGDYGIIDEMQAINPFTMVSADPFWLDPAPGDPLPAEIVAGVMGLRAPTNYLGELDNPDPAEIGGGHWYFDTADNTLIYRVDNAEYFYSSLPGPPRVRLIVEVEYDDRNNNNRFDPVIDEYKSIGLKAIDDYEWRL